VKLKLKPTRAELTCSSPNVYGKFSDCRVLLFPPYNHVLFPPPCLQKGLPPPLLSLLLSLKRQLKLLLPLLVLVLVLILVLVLVLH